MKKLQLYPDKYHTHFSKEPDGLYIEVESPRLIIRTIRKDDLQNCRKLFQAPEAIQKYAFGRPYIDNEIDQRMKLWRDQWEHSDPYSGYAINLKGENSAFIGVVILGHIKPGVAEISYIFFPNFWGKGYGSEAVSALFQSLLPRCIARNFMLDDKAFLLFDLLAAFLLSTGLKNNFDSLKQTQ